MAVYHDLITRSENIPKGVRSLAAVISYYLGEVCVCVCVDHLRVVCWRGRFGKWEEWWGLLDSWLAGALEDLWGRGLWAPPSSSLEVPAGSHRWDFYVVGVPQSIDSLLFSFFYVESSRRDLKSSSRPRP